MKAGRLEDLAPGEFNMVLGMELARALGVRIGDKVTLIAPNSVPRRRSPCRMVVVKPWFFIPVPKKTKPVRVMPNGFDGLHSNSL